MFHLQQLFQSDYSQMVGLASGSCEKESLMHPHIGQALKKVLRKCIVKKCYYFIFLEIVRYFISTTHFSLKSSLAVRSRLKGQTFLLYDISFQSG